MSNRWVKWRETGIVGKDSDLLEMIEEVCTAHNALCATCDEYYRMVIENLRSDWSKLSGIAVERNLPYSACEETS